MSVPQRIEPSRASAGRLYRSVKHTDPSRFRVSSYARRTSFAFLTKASHFTLEASRLAPFPKAGPPGKAAVLRSIKKLIVVLL
jgi:hypothetical protein